MNNEKEIIIAVMVPEGHKVHAVVLGSVAGYHDHPFRIINPADAEPVGWIMEYDPTQWDCLEYINLALFFPDEQSAKRVHGIIRSEYPNRSVSYSPVFKYPKAPECEQRIRKIYCVGNKTSGFTITEIDLLDSEQPEAEWE